MRRGPLALLVLPVLLLTACSAPAPAPASTPKAAESVKPAATQMPVANPADAACTDPKGDGDGFDIRSVEVARVGLDERITVRVSRLPQVTDQGTASVVVSFFDPSGNNGGIFTTKWIGAERSISVFDLNDSMNHYVDDATIVDGKTITMAYPADLIDRAGEGWVWNAVTTLDGADVDTCSNDAFDALGV